MQKNMQNCAKVACKPKKIAQLDKYCTDGVTLFLHLRALFRFTSTALSLKWILPGRVLCTRSWPTPGRRRRWSPRSTPRRLPGAWKVSPGWYCKTFCGHCPIVPGHPEFSVNPIYVATCAPLFINAAVILVYRYYRSSKRIFSTFFLHSRGGIFVVVVIFICIA